MMCGRLGFVPHLLALVSFSTAGDQCYESNGVPSRCDARRNILRGNVMVQESVSKGFCIEKVDMAEGRRESVLRGCSLGDCLSSIHKDVRIIDGAFCGLLRLGEGTSFEPTYVLCCCRENFCNNGSIIRKYLAGNEVALASEQQMEEEENTRVAKGSAVAAAILAALACLISGITLFIVSKFREKKKKVGDPEMLNASRSDDGSPSRMSRDLSPEEARHSEIPAPKY